MQHHWWDVMQTQQVSLNLVWKNYHPTWNNLQESQAKISISHLCLQAFPAARAEWFWNVPPKLRDYLPLWSLIVPGELLSAPPLAHCGWRALSEDQPLDLNGQWVLLGQMAANHLGKWGKRSKDSKITNPLQNKVHMTRGTPKINQIPGGLSQAGKRIWLAHNFTWVHNTAHESASGF